MKKAAPLRVWILSLLCVGAVFTSGFVPTEGGSETYWERQLRLYGKMNLPVAPLLQARYTSCGEAAITMAFNYAHPETKISEEEVIAFALEEGYFTESRQPFTSPADMTKIAEHFAEAVSTGNVQNAEEGLALLTEKLTHGDPVVIDSLARLYNADSGAHFVVVTGLEIDDKNPNKTKILFNDPLTGTNRWGYWLGGEGVWNAWQNNGDPGGAGWWMVIPSP